MRAEALNESPLPPARKALAEFLDVTKTFAIGDGAIRAVEDITLTIGNSEILAVVGPSGCGKTTLLQLLAGFETPTAGEVLLAGVPLRGLNKRCTFMPQTDSLFPWMTVRNNVLYGEDADEHDGDEFLRLVGLEGFGPRWPRELSAGMRKRAEVARAYASHADLLLLDEPFGALDVLTKEAMHLLLQQVWIRDRRTVVFVTHDVEEALFIAHRVVVLSTRPGRVREIVDVPFPFPRPLHLKLSPEFIALRSSVLNRLRGLHGC